MLVAGRHVTKVGTFLALFIFGVAIASILSSESVPITGEQEIRAVTSIAIPQVINESHATQLSGKDWEEFFSNETDIGHRNKNKVEVRCYRYGAGHSFAEIEFHSLGTDRNWKLQQSLRVERDDVIPCDPNVEDFNNDGLKDLTFKSHVAARGANELRTLLIYNRIENNLIHIRNSAEYPNLAYNSNLNCINAWRFHGAITTVFLKLEGDILREFASVGTGEERVATITRRNGERVITRREKMNFEDIYTKYSTFDPPRP